jgi:hypothetical protein
VIDDDDDAWRGPDMSAIAESLGVPAEGPASATAAAGALATAHRVFRRWFGDDYDIDGLDAALSTAAVEQLDGDPVWLVILSGSGNAKTETVLALAGAGAHVTSTIKSEGALLSGTSAKERTDKATGGLLRVLGAHGVMVVKDYTTILSMSGDARAEVLAAMREVYDGSWTRNVGTDGGRSLEWSGRIAVVAACTTAYDTHHSAIAALGDRFAVIRLDSGAGRLAAGRQAIRNVGSEIAMRAELARAVGAVLARIDTTAEITPDVEEDLLYAADLVTLSRTACEYEFKTGLPNYAHMPEMPTRYAKMLGQLYRGGLAVGMDRDDALRLSLRIAHDSIPPLRLAVLLDVADNARASCSAVTKRVQQPRATVDRVLHELHLLGLLVIADDPSSIEDRRVGGRYSLTVDAERVRATTLRRLADVTRSRRTCPKGLRPDQDRSRATYVCSAGGAESGDVLLDHLAGVKANGQGTDRWNVPVQSQYSRDPG